jgi:hypothetical protein
MAARLNSIKKIIDELIPVPDRDVKTENRRSLR